MILCVVSYIILKRWLEQHDKIITQEAQTVADSGTVYKRLHYFTLTGDERFCHILSVFRDFFSQFFYIYASWGMAHFANYELAQENSNN